MSSKKQIFKIYKFMGLDEALKRINAAGKSGRSFSKDASSIESIVIKRSKSHLTKKQREVIDKVIKEFGVQCVDIYDDLSAVNTAIGDATLSSGDVVYVTSESAFYVVTVNNESVVTTNVTQGANFNIPGFILDDAGAGALWTARGVRATHVTDADKTSLSPKAGDNLQIFVDALGGHSANKSLTANGPIYREATGSRYAYLDFVGNEELIDPSDLEAWNFLHRTGGMMAIAVDHNTPASDNLWTLFSTAVGTSDVGVYLGYDNRSSQGSPSAFCLFVRRGVNGTSVFEYYSDDGLSTASTLHTFVVGWDCTGDLYASVDGVSQTSAGAASGPSAAKHDANASVGVYYNGGYSFPWDGGIQDLYISETIPANQAELDAFATDFHAWANK